MRAGWAEPRVVTFGLDRNYGERSLPGLHGLIDYSFAREHALITDFLNETDIPVLDLAPFFRDERDPHALWVSLDDAHPNARAHGLIAKYTLDFLTECAQ